jgi:hypothetical protein
MTISKERQSVLAIIAGLVVVTLITQNFAFLIASFLLAASLPFPILYTPVHKFWMLLSNILGWITRHVILCVLFYLFLTPFAFLLKLLGKQTIEIRWKKEDTFFSDRNHLYTSKDFNNPW